jgi:hypothetical protein
VSQFGREGLPSFADQKRVQDFMPPERRNCDAVTACDPL